MCFSFSLWCSRKGRKMETLLALGKCFTGCMSPQTLERGICLHTHKAALFRAASDEAGRWTPTRQCFCLSSRAASHGVPGAAQQRPLLLLPFCRLCGAAGSGAAAGSRPLPLPAWLEAPQCAHVSQVSAVRPWQQWPRSLCLSPERTSISFCKPESASQIIGGIFPLSDKADYSCSLLLLSWAYMTKTSPSCLNLTATQRYLKKFEGKGIVFSSDKQNKKNTFFSLTFWEPAAQTQKLYFSVMEDCRNAWGRSHWCDCRICCQIPSFTEEETILLSEGIQYLMTIKALLLKVKFKNGVLGLRSKKVKKMKVQSQSFTQHLYFW